ncbi:hypothetical protein [Mycolicibacterium farcinogenes]|uniref:Uncharacterized protein n=1 Tax=Mycolicibacterium farcinogenes TaxID=1802 RepID=A0ACD1FD98_MYCFR|nr:hypothetical protein [Mycolicibacterium farcinogenes]QZH65022.1 hypothetical protein K6L26_23925 [Mycolicibacterium farcinogenes]
MANELEVDAGGLQTAASCSEAVAAGLANAAFSSPASAQPSGAGVAAINAALSSVRQRQSDRITALAGDLATGGARYGTTDSDGGDAISATVRV